MYGTSAYGVDSYGADDDSTFTEIFADTVTAADTLTSTMVAVIADLIRVDSTLSTKATVKNAFADDVRARDFVLRVLREMISDDVTLTDEVSFVYAALTKIVDSLIATGTCSTVLQATNTLAETIYAADYTARSFPVAFSDVAALADTLQAQLTAATALVDQAIAADSLTETVGVTVAFSDTVDADDALSTILQALATVADTVGVVATLVLDGNLYTGVVLNAELGAVSEYANWPFNSMTPFENVYVGAKRDGIYVMQGDTDDGTAIDSFIRTGLIRIAGGLRARIPDAYFGVAAQGLSGKPARLYIKAITTDSDGTKHEYWYELERREGDSPTGTRVKIGRGLSSIYWQFELHAIDGTHFNLDTIQLHPMALQRRIP